MLKIIQNLTEIESLNKAFVAKVQANNPISIDNVKITWRPDKRICTVQFLEQYELYWFHELNVSKKGYLKHLNLFVTNPLVKGKHISHNTQINFPADPKSHPKGAFAKDAENQIYILYAGKIDASINFQTVEAEVSPHETKQYIMVCSLEAPDFMDRLMDFIKKREEMKAASR